LSGKEHIANIYRTPAELQKFEIFDKYLAIRDDDIFFIDWIKNFWDKRVKKHIVNSA
jgi:hypothetical protein